MSASTQDLADGVGEVLALLGRFLPRLSRSPRAPAPFGEITDSRPETVTRIHPGSPSRHGQKIVAGWNIWRTTLAGKSIPVGHHRSKSLSPRRCNRSFAVALDSVRSGLGRLKLGPLPVPG